MEELRSTEILDKEIRKQSQDKAAEILKRGEETARSLLDGVEDKFNREKINYVTSMDERLKLFEANVTSSLPLEQLRSKVRYVQEQLIVAMNAYFSSMDDMQILNILQKSGEKKFSLFEGKKVSAKVYGLSVEKARTIIEKKLGSSLADCSLGNEYDLMENAVAGFSCRKGIRLVSDDGRLVVRLTLDEIVTGLLDTYRQEITDSLFEGRIR